MTLQVSAVMTDYIFIAFLSSKMLDNTRDLLKFTLSIINRHTVGIFGVSSSVGERSSPIPLSSFILSSHEFI